MCEPVQKHVGGWPILSPIFGLLLDLPALVFSSIFSSFVFTLFCFYSFLSSPVCNCLLSIKFRTILISSCRAYISRCGKRVRHEGSPFCSSSYSFYSFPVFPSLPLSFIPLRPFLAPSFLSYPLSLLLNAL